MQKPAVSLFLYQVLADYTSAEGGLQELVSSYIKGSEGHLICRANMNRAHGKHIAIG